MQVKEVRDIETGKLQGYQIIDEGIFVPIDPLNRHYQEIQKWIEEGNTPEQAYTIDDLRAYLLKKLDSMTKSYITSYYPYTKQQSDVADKEYYGSALLMINSTYTTDSIYKATGEYANQIFDGTSTLSDILSTLPETEQAYWEQLIKVAVRITFVIRCKNVYYQVKQVIENADLYTTEEELRNIQFEFDTTNKKFVIIDNNSNVSYEFPVMPNI